MKQGHGRQPLSADSTRTGVPSAPVGVPSGSRERPGYDAKRPACTRTKTPSSRRRLGRRRRSEDSPQQPCQGGGRGFESRRPLQVRGCFARSRARSGSHFERSFLADRFVLAASQGGDVATRQAAAERRGNRRLAGRPADPGSRGRSPRSRTLDRSGARGRAERVRRSRSRRSSWSGLIARGYVRQPTPSWTFCYDG
jgi:hypothetical protein